MSTRCQIVTVQSDGKLYPVKIYKHCGGYPSGVMPTLAPYVKSFAAGRGEDPEYLMAQIIGAFSRAHAEDGPGSPGHFTGWGVSTFWHSDIAYLYIVSPNGSVKIIDPEVRDELPDDELPPGMEVGWTPEADA